MSDGPASDLSGNGQATAEQEWLSALADLDLPPLEEPLPSRLLVVAPHPEDEVLGVGGLVQSWSRMGVEVQVLAVTDGERSKPAGWFGRRVLARRHHDESVRAQRRLGSHATLDRLLVPDGKVEERVGEVSEAVLARLDPDCFCAVTWRGDGHPDHEASGVAAAEAATTAGARLLEFPVWMWHWARPGDTRVPWHRAKVAFLDGSALLAKRAALSEFRTQLQASRPLLRTGKDAGPTLSPAALERFRRPFEVVFT